MSRRTVIALAPLVSLVVVAIGIMWLLSSGLPERAPEPLELGAENFAFIMGSGRVENGRLQIDTYTNGFALLSSGPIAIDAGDYALLDVDLRTATPVRDPDRAPAFFWRTVHSGGQVHRISLTGIPMVLLSGHADWDGKVSEVGFLIPEHERSDAVIGGLALRGESIGARMRLMLRGWLDFEPWTQRTINFVYGGAEDQRIALVSVVTVWVLLSILGILLGARGTASIMPAVIACLLAGWLILDARWTFNRMRQAAESVRSLMGTTVDERIAARPDGALYRYVERIKEKHLGAAPKRIILVGNRERESYYQLRAKYHLLPHAVNERTGLRNQLPAKNLDYALFLGPFTTVEEGEKDVRALLDRLPIESSWRPRLRLVEADTQGILFAVSSSGR